MIRPIPNNFTGQGFKGERALAVTAVLLTIVSTLLLIDLTLTQKRHLNNEMKNNK
jgi:hypothetical protein